MRSVLNGMLAKAPWQEALGDLVGKSPEQQLTPSSTLAK